MDKPTWGCDNWYDYGHDWLECPECTKQRRAEVGRGVYYTPAQVLDPACGTGAFLAYLVDPLISNPPYASR